MKTLFPIEQNFWDDYVKTLPKENKPNNPFVEASFSGTKEITDDLIVLFLLGKKNAGSSVVEDFETMGEPLPVIGNYWIVLSRQMEPKLIAKTVKVTINKFMNVPAEIATAEGEGDLSIEYWRKVHSELYIPHLAEWNLKSMGDATIITEFFEIVYR